MHNIKKVVLIVILALSGKSLEAQVTVKQLNRYFRKESHVELEQLLKEKHLESIKKYEKLENDTNRRVTQLFNETMLKRRNQRSAQYFFLPETSPAITIGDTLCKHSNYLMIRSYNDSLIPLEYDPALIKAINEFIGERPEQNTSTKAGKRQWKKYNQRMSFIGKVIFLPGSWGKLSTDLVPYRIKRLEFNKEMTRVRLSVDLTASGGTYIYILKEGVWILKKTCLEWIH